MTTFKLRTLLLCAGALCLAASNGGTTAEPSAGSEGKTTAPAPGPVGQEVKIGFVSLKKISDESLRKKAFEEEVKRLLEEKKPERDAIQKEINDLETARTLSGPEQAKKDDEKIQRKKVELLRFDSALRQEIEKRQTRFEKEIMEEIATAVREVAQEKGYTWVLADEVLLHKDDSADLTFQTLVKMNERFLKNRSETKEKAGEKTPSVAEPVSASAEDAMMEELVKSGVRNRHTMKEIQPRKGSASGSITMKGEGGNVRFLSQYPKDLTGGAGGVVAAPMGDKSVWRFVGEVSLSGYTFTGLDERRPLTFILLNEIGLVHLYGRGAVVFPDGHSVAMEEEEPLPSQEGGKTQNRGKQ